MTLSPYPFVFVSPGTRGLSLALVRHFLRTTRLPIYTTYRRGTPESVTEDITSGLKDDEKTRVKTLRLDLTQESTIADAADALARALPKDKDPYLHTAFITGGVLYPERQPADLDFRKIEETFRINTISHLLMIKHFSQFLPSSRATMPPNHFSKWIHVSARVGSVSDNKLGGWFSYRASKSAINQIVKTFDLDLKHRRARAICVGVHPGTVKTELSREFWGSVKEGGLFEKEYAAEKMIEMVQNLEEKQRGRIWDWEGKEINP
ncbi:hypothetical protein K488DRAFT_41983 [Vararia minispora EC-137]|uniref:Uncharacterized protein n=1 Tax=Vararia minispora EC-137 TaxID=1314806 RepID=A0ACB8QWS2_9AGAM|nr:hypothetical protein K488DRAFT_41983 [Vararia minispora EC-137]